MIPLTEANFTTSLAVKMSDSATSLTLNKSTDDDGNTLSGTYTLTFDEGTAKEEHMIVTLSGASGTVVTRGLSRVDVKTNKSANQFEHDRGAVVKMTDINLIRVISRLNGSEAFDSVDWTGVQSIDGLATPTSGETTKVCNVDYANALAIAGAPDMTESVKGIGEAATSAEVASGTDSGSTTAPLVVRPSKLAEVIQKGSYLYFTEDGTGSDDTYTATLTPTLSAYTAGQMFVGKITVANTGACTLNLDGLGAKNIKKYVNGTKSDLETGDIAVNQYSIFIYDGTDFIFLNGTSLTQGIQQEVSSFFGATDITGAEAETLTDGSDASALHEHKKSTILSTRAGDASSGAVTYAHGLGVTPKWVRITCSGTNSGNSRAFQSYGTYDGTTNKCAYVGNIGGTPNRANSTSYAVAIYMTSLNQTGVVTVDSTNVTITWTLGSAETGTADLIIECEA